MRNYKDILPTIANFLIIVLLLFFIVFGLNRIGILELPDFVERIFSDSDTDVNILPNDNGKIYSSLSDGLSTDTIEVISSISQNNVRKLLEDVIISNSYYHELTKTLFDDKNSVSESVIVRRSQGLSDISVFDSLGNIKKRITEQNDGILVTEHDSNSSDTAILFPKGSITAEQESGVVMTHKDFLDSEYILREGDFSVAYSNYGTVMQIVFETTDSKYPQTNKYWLSLDYGVVVRAECYENNVLVYLLETNTIGTDVG